ncbi:MAG: tRNA lysidine(34) synthetase TilS [Acidimicrobiia bacterium]
MAGTRRLRSLVGSVLERTELPDRPLVVALSGGADSAALAFVCREAGRELRALYVDHGFTHSPMMGEAARRIAAQLEVQLEVVDVDVPEGASPEGQARRVRYRAFLEATGGGEALLTAHTRDDDAETILMNIARGTGPQGLAGIPRFRPPNIYRPLLEVSRSETREISALAGLPFAEDPMNKDPALTRNLVRLELLPALTRLNPQVAEAIHRMGKTLARDLECLERLAAATHVSVGEGWASVPVGALLAKPRAVADRVLLSALTELTGRGEVNTERLERVWRVVEGASPREQVGGGVVCERKGPMVVFRRGGAAPARGPVRLTPGVRQAAGMEFWVVRVDAPCRVAPLSKWAAVFPPDAALEVRDDGVVCAGGEPAWIPGVKRLPVAWYEPGSVGYLSVLAREESG